jgi:hypothetical protein
MVRKGKGKNGTHSKIYRKTDTMKVLLCMLVVCWSATIQGQDYLSRFSEIRPEQLTVVVEEFDALQIQIIGSSGMPYVVELDSLQTKTPPVFGKMQDDLIKRHGNGAVVEIIYRICYSGDCAIRYNISTREGLYVNGAVYVEYDTAHPSKSYVAIDQLSSIFTLHQLLNIMDKSNIDSSHPLSAQLLPCYKSTMFNKADVACLLSVLINTPEAERKVFLNQIGSR